MPELPEVETVARTLRQLQTVHHCYVVGAAGEAAGEASRNRYLTASSKNGKASSTSSLRGTGSCE